MTLQNKAFENIVWRGEMLLLNQRFLLFSQFFLSIIEKFSSFDPIIFSADFLNVIDSKIYDLGKD